MTPAMTVYIVDDDAAVRDSVSLMLGLAGYRTATFADAEAFETAWRPDWAGCVLADLRMPGKSGLDLLQDFRARGVALPFVIMTAHGDVPSARAAFLAEAVDFLEKPFSEAQLRSAVEQGFARDARRSAASARREADAGKLERLTPREREVLGLAAQGLHAKEIGARLGISPRTVEVHKAHLMDKLGVRNVAELVRFAVAALPDRPEGS